MQDVVEEGVVEMSEIEFLLEHFRWVLEKECRREAVLGV